MHGKYPRLSRVKTRIIADFITKYVKQSKRIEEIHIVIYVIKPFYWLTYFTTEFETAGETFEILGPNGH